MTLPTGAEQRAYWLEWMLKAARPVFENLAQGQLKQQMPIVCKPGRDDRAKYAHLEAFGRSLAGIAPWLATPSCNPSEETERLRWIELTRSSIANATNPSSLDFQNFDDGHQCLVDAAFLCHGLLRAFDTLWLPLEEDVKRNLISCLKAAKRPRPRFNNYLLFAAMIETFLYRAGEEWDSMRIDYALRQHEQWYVGDGAYKDGTSFHWDYYNSFVIQPMLIDILDIFKGSDLEWDAFAAPLLERCQRYAQIQERLIAPDGSFPPIGRSLSYRFGAFQLLSQLALQNKLPSNLSLGQVRCALDAAIRRVPNHPLTFDGSGWLQIGLCGHQPGLGEGYISTGSLYLCLLAFLPLGIRADEPFWTDESKEWTSLSIWIGKDTLSDHHL